MLWSIQALSHQPYDKGSNGSEGQSFVRTKVRIDGKNEMCLKLSDLTRKVVRNMLCAPLA